MFGGGGNIASKPDQFTKGYKHESFNPAVQLHFYIDAENMETFMLHFAQRHCVCVWWSPKTS